MISPNNLRLPEEACILHLDAAVVQNVRYQIDAGNLLLDDRLVVGQRFGDALADFLGRVRVLDAENHCVGDPLPLGA